MEGDSTVEDDIDKDTANMRFDKASIGSKCALFVNDGAYANVLYFGHTSGVLSVAFKTSVDSLTDIRTTINGAKQNSVAGLTAKPECLALVRDDAKRMYALGVDGNVYVQN